MRSVLCSVVLTSWIAQLTVGAPELITKNWLKFWKVIHHDQEQMGQAVRVMKYDRASNEAGAISSLDMLGNSLSWYRLDDGVMGGQSETLHSNERGGLHFSGTINTNGGGFTSIRAKIPEELIKDVKAIRLRYRGDGKTYKLILSDGKGLIGGPFVRTPSWQIDLPTLNQHESGDCQEIDIPLNSLLPAWGGRPSSKPSVVEQQKHKFDPKEMREIGFMLSLKLSDGTPNPKETFGEGIFPFSLLIESIEPILVDTE